jgi:Mg-chelatase subunit ChlD
VAAIERALSTWTAITLPARMLAVIDVSGSMLQRVPSAGNATRAQVTAEAARRGLGLFDDSWAVGLWAFATELVGKRDYRELAPIGPLTSNRNRLAAGLNELAPKRNGGTGLYDTLLAAYKTVQAGWDPGRVNSVVMLTDGENEDDKGIKLPQLLDELKRIKDPKRPIQVVLVGIGPSVGPGALRQITGVTGGGVFTTEDPAKIGDIFLQAVALRTKVSQPR